MSGKKIEYFPFFCTFENDLILFSAAFWPILKKEVEQSQVRRHVGSGPDWFGIWTKGYYRGKRKVSHRVSYQHSSHIINHKLPYSCGKNNNSSILTLFRPPVETGTTNVSTYYLRKTLTRWRCQNKDIHTYVPPWSPTSSLATPLLCPYWVLKANIRLNYTELWLIADMNYNILLLSRLSFCCCSCDILLNETSVLLTTKNVS